MAAEQFNDPFWVAIAAAAPVIGLATLVSAERAARAFERAGERAPEEGSRRPRFPGLAFWYTGINVVAQSAVLVMALSSLATRMDARPKIIPTLIEAFGMGTTFLPALMVGLAPRSRR
jgi:hypothetical protein